MLKKMEKPQVLPQLGNGLVHFFGGNDLNRLSGHRKDPEWISKHVTDAATDYLVLSGSQVLLKGNVPPIVNICRPNDLTLVGFFFVCS